MAELTLTTLADRPDLRDEAWEAVNSKGFPEFMYHDPVADRFFGELAVRVPTYQLFLLDTHGRIAVTGNCIPFRWDGEPSKLPDRGWDAVLEQGVADHTAGRTANVVSALQIVVRRDLLGTGLASRGLAAMRAVVADHGIDDLVAPVRPSSKDRYPLTPMDRYLTWTRPDGLHVDPWLRVHQRAGASVVKVAPESMRIEAPVADWEDWTGMALPDSGDYVIPGALNPIHIDRGADRGVYIEPNVWMHHRLR